MIAIGNFRCRFGNVSVGLANFGDRFREFSAR